ncbi:MAG: S9 family peptidase [Bryobacterales bacterium]|nr:S9 family peptidase [Acidobacteriota bacterium]MCB9384784.1 S9 family peptidase [Bryobacterales bacterium]
MRWILAFVMLGCAFGASPTLDDLDSLDSLGGVAVRPDGKRVAYTLTSGRRGARSTDIQVIAIARGAAQALAKGGSPAWSPDGETLAYFGAGRQVFTVSAAGGNPRKLSDLDAYIDRFQWSPDGKTIALLARPRNAASLTFLVTQQAPTPTVVDHNNLPRNSLWLVDAQTGKTRRLTDDTFSVGGYEQWFADGFSWAPDSKTIAFSKRPHAKAGSHLDGEIATVDVASGEVKVLTNRPGFDGFPVYSPDGRSIVFNSTERRDWVTVSHLYRLHLATGESEKLTTAFDRKLQEFFVDGENAIFLAPDGVATQIYALDLRTKQSRQLTSGPKVRSSLSVAGGTLAYLEQSADEPPQLVTLELKGGSQKTLTDLNRHTAAWPKVETRVLRWPSFDGMEIEGILHLPAGYREGQRYPLVVIPHGGPHAVQTDTFVTGERRVFADRGWAVFRPNFRGSGGYGERFLRANLLGFGLGDYQDVMTGVDMLIEKGIVDSEKMAIVGASYGGYMTSWTISQTDRFKAAVAGAAITNVASFIRSTDVPDRFQDYLGKDPRLWDRHSPLHYASNMVTPTLIWHGDGDIRVPLMQSRELYTALRDNGTPTEFVIYHGEAHGVSRPEHVRDLMERKIAWLDHWVLGK